MMWKKLMGFVDVDPNPKTDFLERRKLYIVGKETMSDTVSRISFFCKIQVGFRINFFVVKGNCIIS